MSEQLFCIRCEKMVNPYSPFVVDLFHMNTVQVSNSPDPGSRFDLVTCEFPDGFAHCPPPEFDMDEFMETFGTPLAVESDFLPYSYDVERDEIVQEVLI